MQRLSTTIAIYQATLHDKGAVQLPLKNGEQHGAFVVSARENGDGEFP
jgi:hypothetical protein